MRVFDRVIVQITKRRLVEMFRGRKDRREIRVILARKRRREIKVIPAALVQKVTQATSVLLAPKETPALRAIKGIKVYREKTARHCICSMVTERI